MTESDNTWERFSLDRPLDTSEEAQKILVASLQRLGPEGRLRKSFEASAALKRRIEQGIQMRHPEYSERQVFLARARIYLGEELYDAVYGGEGVHLP